MLLLVIGCGGGEGTTVHATSGGGSGTRLAAEEKKFNPSAYNPSVRSILSRESQFIQESSSSAMYVAAAPETIPGFRIQVMLTPEIDSATAVFDSLNQSLADDWIYVVYDSPYYKVRVGNYAERSDAAPMLNLLIGRGYRDAWIVPDNVMKSPPPRLSPELLREERPIDRRW
jgi:hypothetical protein